ncbi:hypothetical protein ACLEEB_02460 [Lonsdalea quercina]|uniref:hypothetical protein n=1 Tax=Lonsdalea quercina TaxID=71657 RepID=UPI003976CBE6
MLSNIKVSNVVFGSIKTVLLENEIQLDKEITLACSFIDDLYFTSLMIAQLIMLVQEEIDYEPFYEDYAISDVVKVQDFIKIYSKEV